MNRCLIHPRMTFRRGKIFLCNSKNSKGCDFDFRTQYERVGGYGLFEITGDGINIRKYVGTGSKLKYVNLDLTSKTKTLVVIGVDIV
jgi:hypothetical protein